MPRRIGFSLALIGALTANQAWACGIGTFGAIRRTPSPPRADVAPMDVTAAVAHSVTLLAIEGRQGLYLHAARTLPDALVGLVTAHEKGRGTDLAPPR